MSNTLGYTCIACHKQQDFSYDGYTCPDCNNNLQISYDYDKIRTLISRETLNDDNNNSMWRYKPFYPVENEINTLSIGWTPLYKTDRLAQELGLTHVYVKDDGRNPSASFKDRASAMVLARALDKNISLITGASTGNAASSMACLSASIGIQPIIFLPVTAPQAKLAQLLIFGANLISVNGSYDQAFDLCLKATEKYGWYNRNTGFNPFTREGKKSCAFEICEQMNWDIPDYVFVSVGDGNIISGLWKGFTDFQNAGLIDKVPKLVACQAERSNAVMLGFAQNTAPPTVDGTTVADSISVSLPRDGLAAVQALKDSQGFAVSLKDEEILDAIKPLAMNTGVFSEPAGAATYAGLKKAVQQGKINTSDKVVLVITGNGLKDVQSAMSIAGSPLNIDPDESNLNLITNSQ